MVDHDQDSSTPCLNCPNGMYSPIGATACVLCADGAVDADGDSATQCLGCLPGQVIENAAVFAAAYAEAAIMQDPNSTLGVVVPPPASAGSRNEHAEMVCVDCPVGMHDADRDPSTWCVPCQAGSFSAAGVTECSLCKPGMADTDSNPGTPCVACPSSEDSCYTSRPVRHCTSPSPTHLLIQI